MTTLNSPLVIIRFAHLIISLRTVRLDTFADEGNGRIRKGSINELSPVDVHFLEVRKLFL